MSNVKKQEQLDTKVAELKEFLKLATTEEEKAKLEKALKKAETEADDLKHTYNI